MQPPRRQAAKNQNQSNRHDAMTPRQIQIQSEREKSTASVSRAW